MADSPPPAYRPEWDPNYRPHPSAPPAACDINFQEPEKVPLDYEYTREPEFPHSGYRSPRRRSSSPRGGEYRSRSPRRHSPTPRRGEYREYDREHERTEEYRRSGYHRSGDCRRSREYHRNDRHGRSGEYPRDRTTNERLGIDEFRVFSDFAGTDENGGRRSPRHSSRNSPRESPRNSPRHSPRNSPRHSPRPDRRERSPSQHALLPQTHSSDQPSRDGRRSPSHERPSGRPHSPEEEASACAQTTLPYSETRTKVTLIDRQNYTGPVIIAPGQSIEEPKEDGGMKCVFCSVLVHANFFVWLFIFIWQYKEGEKYINNIEGTNYNDKLWFASVFLMPFSILFVMFESMALAMSSPLMTKDSMREAADKVRRIRQAKIKVRWDLECYHNETETHPGPYGERVAEERKVVTRSATEYFYCNEVLDVSQNFGSADFGYKCLVQVYFTTKFGFADEFSQNVYNRALEEFSNKHKEWDKKYSVKETLEVIPPRNDKETRIRRRGHYAEEKKMEEYVVVLNNEEEDGTFMNGVFYCCFSCVCFFGLLYRVWVHVNTGPARYTYLKLRKM